MIGLADAWTATETVPLLDGDSVHVWLVDLDDARTDEARLLGVLAGDEAERAERFWFDRDRRHYARCRGVLRHLLGAYLGADPRELVIEAGPMGKPFLPKTPLAFNVSHSGSYALIAFSRRADVGVDIEAHRALPDRDVLARQCFSAREFARLQSLPDAVRTRAFFTCWSRKEAYVKAVGDGLAYPLDAFDVTFAPGEPARLSVPGERTHEWTLEALDVPSGYSAALVTEGRRRIACLGWTPRSQQETV
jgi:4'-phosphopantetheinyl transferase